MEEADTTIKLRGYVPLEATNYDFTDTSGNLIAGHTLTFKDIFVPIRAKIFGIERSGTPKAYIKNIGIASLEKTDNQDYPTTMIINTVVEFDLEQVMHVKLKFLHIYPAEGIDSCLHSADGAIIVRISTAEDNILGLGMDMLTNLAETSDWQELTTATVSSLLCLPNDLVEIANANPNLSMLKASDTPLIHVSMYL